MRDVRTTTKSRIQEYLRYRGGWISGSELEGCAEAWGTKSSVISRRARELANDGTINRTLSPRKTVQYASNGTFESAREANLFIKSLEVV